MNTHNWIHKWSLSHFCSYLTSFMMLVESEYQRQTQPKGHWSKPFHFSHQKLDTQNTLESLHSWLKWKSHLSTFNTFFYVHWSRRHSQATATFQCCFNLSGSKSHHRVLKKSFYVSWLKTIYETKYYTWIVYHYIWNKLQTLNIF